MKKRNVILLEIIFSLFIAIAIISCNRPENKNIPAYQPGLGEFMMQMEYHHHAMDMALKDSNIARVHYEADEINEVAEQIEIFHNNHEKLKQAFSTWRSSVMEQPLKILAVSSSADSLKINYAILTANCNSCHQGNGVGFIKVKE